MFALRHLLSGYAEWLSLFRRSWHSAVVSIASQSLATVTVALASRGLGAQGYGEVAAIAAYYGWFSLISSYSTHALLPRLVADPDATPEARGRACATTFWLTLALTLASLALAVPLLPLGLRQLNLEALQAEAMLYALLVIVGQANGILLTISQAAGWLRQWSAVGFLGGLLPVAALAGYQAIGGSLAPMTYLQLSLACSLITTAFAFALFRRAVGSWRYLRPDPALAKPMLKAGRGPWIASASNVLASFGTSTLIAAHLAKSELGHYEAVLALHAWVNTVGLSVAVPALADWARSAERRDYAAMRADIRRRQLSTAVVMGTAAVIAFVFAEPVLHVLFGPEFVPAAPVLRILTLSWVGNGLGGWYWYFMFAAGEPWRVAPSNIAYGVPGFAIAFVLLTFTSLGIAGAAIARVAGLFLWVIVYEWNFRAVVRHLQA